MIKSVAVVKLEVNNGSGDGGSCFGIEVWTDTAKLANMVIAIFGDRYEIWSEKVRCSSNMKPRYADVFQHPLPRLASRRPSVDTITQWTEDWSSASVVNHTIVTDPTIRQPGFDLPRHT